MNILTLPIDLYGLWRLEFFFGLAIGAWFLIPNFFAWEARALWAYVLTYALYTLEFPNWSYGAYHTAFQAIAGQTFAEVLVIPLMVILLALPIKRLIPHVVAFEVGSVWITGFGLMHRESFDTAFIALCLPYLSPRGLWPWVRYAALITIFIHHGSTALMIVAAQYLPTVWRLPKCRPVFFGLILPAFALIAYAHHNGPWLDGEERLAAWGRYMAFWASDWRTMAFGTGPGSFMWCSLMIDKFKAPMFLHMHNDWLQVTFELGLVGLVLVGLTMRRALKTAWNWETNQIGAILGAAAFCLTYHPLRFFPSAIVIALIFREALVVYETGV